MLRITRTLALCGAIALLGVAPAGAQTYEAGDRYQDEGVILYGAGGGSTTFADVNDMGANFDTGWGLGGGIGYQINRHLAIRADLNFSRAQARIPTMPAANNQDFDKYFYGVDAQLRYPGSMGIAPYIVVGVGAVTVDPRVAGLDTFTRGAGKVGAGIGYHFRDSGASLFAEWDGWVYGWDDKLAGATGSTLGKTQFDTAWTGGLRYTF